MHELGPGPMPARRLCGGALSAWTRGQHGHGGHGAIGHDPGPPACMGREDAVIKHQIDPGARRPSRQLFQPVETLEEQMARAVCPGRLEREQNAAVTQEPEPVLTDGRAQKVAAELLEPRAVPAWHCDIGMEVEAIEMRVPRGAGEDPRGVRLLAHAPHAGARAAPQSDAPLDRGAADAGQGRRFFREDIRRRHVGLDIEAPAPKEAPHSRADRREYDANLFVRGGWCRLEAQPLLRALGEDAVEDQRVEVDIEVQPAAEALHDGDATRLTSTKPAPSRAPALEGGP